ncbi:hypothetical protein F5051DRAFT_295649, partial [Lentinula edodes]
MSQDTKRKLQEFWKTFTYLIIDEYSMISKSFLANLERHIAIGKLSDGNGLLPSFGGVNIILCGDLHQFPPVAVGASEALFYPVNLAKDKPEAQIGRTLYEEFSTVVILRKQMRVTDPTWRDFLVHLRYGKVQSRHLDMLRTLVVSNSTNPKTDFDQEPWLQMSLVTPRHTVRERWNEEAIRKHCRRTGNRLFICHTSDTIRNKPLNLCERYGLAMHNAKSTSSSRRKKSLPDRVELAIGAKVLVTQNIETDLDITNGARGKIVEIVFDPREPQFEENCSVVELEYMPLYVLVKMDRTRA